MIRVVLLLLLLLVSGIGSDWRLGAEHLGLGRIYIVLRCLDLHQPNGRGSALHLLLLRQLTPDDGTLGLSLFRSVIVIAAFSGMRGASCLDLSGLFSLLSHARDVATERDYENL